MRKVTSVFLVLVLALSTLTVVIASRPDQMYDEWMTLEERRALDADIDATHGEGFAANEREAMRLLDSIHLGFGHTRTGDDTFPDYFGGMYIGEDGRAVVLIVESMYDEAMTYSNIGSLIDQGVTYRLVESSYAKLREIQAVIGAALSESIEKRRNSEPWCVYAYNANLISVRQRNNQVIVRLAVYNEEMIAGFRQHVYDSPLIIFEYGAPLYIGGPPADAPFHYYDIYGYMSNGSNGYIDPEMAASFTVSPGMRLYRNFSMLTTPHGSLGFRVYCTLTGTLGIVSSGHVFRTVVGGGVHEWANPTPFGTVVRYRISGTMDAAFIRTGPSVNALNTLPGGQMLSPNVPHHIYENMQVSMAGGRTGGTVSGRVTDLNAHGRGTCHSTGFSNDFTRVIMTNIGTNGGDSGGVVFHTNNLQTTGIVAGGNRDQMFFVTARDVMIALNVSRY